ncbi:MAG TPA: hypothetical protein VND94_18980 [Terriglobia bacterium]|nr:hypothetical protein [Terriglobia bacterium]
MRKALLLAAGLMAAAISTATAQNAPVYQPPAGLAPSSTGAVPASGNAAPASAATAAPSKAAAAPTAPASSTPATSGTAPVADQKVQKIVTQVVDETEIAGDGAQPPVTAKLPNLKTQPKLADIGDKLDNVRLVGTSATTAIQNGKRVAITWTTVTRVDTGRTINVETPLASNLRVTGASLPANTKITAKGDATDLYTAIRSLFDDQAAQQISNTTGGSASKKSQDAAPTASGPASTNGDVTAQPQKTASQDNSSDSSSTETPTYDTTTNGCTIRVDLGQMQAIQQEATTTTIGGKTTQGACEDGMTRYSIQKTGLGCSDVVGDNQAQGQTRLYYVGDDGKPVTVQDCTPDAELVYPFADEAGTCTPQIDNNAMMVYDQVQTVYHDNKNTRIVVNDCHPTGDGYQLLTTTDGCSLRDDFDKKQTVEQNRQYYTKGGEQHFTSSCQDDANTYPMQVEACQPIVDSTAMKVFNAQRYFINLPTGKSYRSECAPIDSGTDLQATTDGCEMGHYDYPSAEQSRGAARLYYMNAGAPVYLTQCQEDTTVYKWNFVRTGWQNDDAALTSSELLAAHITLPGGDVEVSPAAVRSESTIQPYASQGTQDVPNGQPKTYIGCNAYTPTTRSQVYQRADNTTYTIAIGAGDPQGPVDECTRTVQSQTVFAFACDDGTQTCSGSARHTTFQPNNSPQLCQVLVHTGINWNANQQRTVTQYPVGAGGSTTTTAWTTISYLNGGTYGVYERDNNCASH